jgi:hypothetical protein
MSKVSLEKVTDQDLEELKGKCNALEAKMTQIMLEILEELELQWSDETLDCKVKEEIKTLTNKIFELNEPELSTNERS